MLSNEPVANYDFTSGCVSLSVSPSLQTEAELICVRGVWDRVVSCQPVDCGPPPQSHVYFASFSCPWGTTFGKQCTFSCNAPAILQGEDGNWATV